MCHKEQTETKTSGRQGRGKTYLPKRQVEMKWHEIRLNPTEMTIQSNNNVQMYTRISLSRVCTSFHALSDFLFCLMS